jgi:hypothetical protein
MSVDFGTYEGHRILSDAATKLADRVQSGFQFKEEMQLDEKKRKDQAKRWDHQNLVSDAQARDIHSTASRRDLLAPSELAEMQAGTQQTRHITDKSEHNFLRQQIDEGKADLTEDIRRKYYDEMSTKLKDFDIYDEEVGEMRGEAIPMLLQAIENTYPKDIMELDPEGKLDLQQVTDIGADIHKLYTNEVMSRMVNELSKAGLDKSQIDQLVGENPELRGALDSFYREGMGVNPADDATFNPIEKGLYGDNSVHGNLSYVENAITNLPDKFDNVEISQDPVSGVVTLEESDFFDNDEYTVNFDGRRPYIMEDNKKVYLDDHDALYEAFEG